MTINRVTGLRPMGDRPSSGRRNKPRVDTPTGDDIRMPGLRPTARPVDTYVQPQAPSQSNSLLQLAEALGQVNPTIQNFLNEEAARQRKDAEDRALKRIGGMSYDEAKAAVESGSIPEMDNPWFKAAFMKVMGERTAYNTMHTLSAQYATDPNRHEIDFSTYVRNATQGDLEAFDDPHFNSGYLPLMGNFEATGAAKHVEVQTARAMEEAKANVFGVFLGQAQQASVDGRDPKTVAGELFARYAGQEEFLRLSPADQDALMMDVISTLANDGDWELVDALLNHPRQDEFGNVSSLATSPQYAVKTADITRRAKAAQGEKLLEQSITSLSDLHMAASNGTLTAEGLQHFTEAHPNVISGPAQVDLLTRSMRAQEQAAAELAQAEAVANQKLLAEQSTAAVRQANLAAVQDGTFAFAGPVTVPDANGKERQLTTAQQEEMLAEDLSAAVKAMGEEGGADPATVLDTEIKLFATAGVTNPRWAEVFSRGQSQAHPANLKQFMEDGTAILPPGLEAAIPLFEAISMNAPGVLGRYFSDATTLEFFRTVVDAKKYTGADNATAVRQAIMAQINGPSTSSQATMTREQVDKTLRDLRIGGGWWMPIRSDLFGFDLDGKDVAANIGIAETFINNAIKHYASAGFVGEKARQAAVERFKQDHIDINGFYVNVAGLNIGDREQFTHAVELVFNELLSDQPRYFNGQELHAEDLSIQPTTGGNGEWMVVSKTSWGVGLPLADIPPINFSNMAGALQREADARIAEIEYEQRKSRYIAEINDAQARPAYIADLESMIAGMERWQSSPHLQQAFGNTRGQAALDAYRQELPAKIAERKAELERLRGDEALYLLNSTTGANLPDLPPPTPIPSLLKF